MRQRRHIRHHQCALLRAQRGAARVQLLQNPLGMFAMGLRQALCLLGLRQRRFDFGQRLARGTMILFRLR